MLILEQLYAEEAADSEPTVEARADFLSDPNLEVLADEDDELTVQQNVLSVDDEEEAIRREEAEHIQVLDINKRISCYAHDIILVLHKVADSVLQISHTIAQMLTLVRHFKRSVVATELLIKKCRKVLLLPPRTRWNYMFIVLDRILDVKDSLNQCCIELELPSLSGRYAELKALRDLLEPFYHETNFLHAENYVTISSVYPMLKKLIFDLEFVENMQRFACLGSLRTDSIAELRRRFFRVPDYSHEKFHPVYLVATSLDPNLAYLIETEAKDTIQRQLLAMVQKYCPSTEQNQPTTIAPQSLTTSGLRFGAFAAMMALEKRQRAAVTTSPTFTIEQKIQRYLSLFADSAPVDTIDPLEFWRSNAEEYDQLSELAFLVLPIPATSAPVERVISSVLIMTGQSPSVRFRSTFSFRKIRKSESGHN